MSYSAIVTALHARFATITALERILDHEPTSGPGSPFLYSVLDGFRRVMSHGGQKVTVTYRILHRLCIHWQDHEQAEQDLMPLVNSIPAAVESDWRLGGLLHGGQARMAEGDSGWISIGGTEYRRLDFFSEVSEVVELGTG